MKMKFNVWGVILDVERKLNEKMVLTMLTFVV